MFLAPEGGRIVLLPLVVKCAEEHQTVGEDGAHRTDGRLLLRDSRRRLPVGRPTGRPTGLGDDGVLPAAGERNLLSLAEHEGAGLLGGDVAVEKRMAVGGGVVRGLA